MEKILLEPWLLKSGQTILSSITESTEQKTKKKSEQDKKTTTRKTDSKRVNAGVKQKGKKGQPSMPARIRKMERSEGGQACGQAG